MKSFPLLLSTMLLCSLLAACSPGGAAATPDAQLVETSVAGTLAAMPGATSAPAPTATEAAQPTSEPVTNAVAGNLYIGTVEGQSAVFVPDANNPASGALALADNSQRSPFNFSDLQDARLLSAAPNPALQTVNFIFDSSHERLFISAAVPDASSTFTDNAVYSVPLQTHMPQEVWRNKLSPNGSRYGKYQGAATLVLAQGDYLVLSVAPCWGCEYATPSDSIVLNLKTAAEKNLGEIGNVSIDSAAGTVSYQLLAPVQVTCDPGPGCDNGYSTDYQPAGKSASEALP